ncbi:MAG: UvrD-helicase domain-containing protein [Candidatus Latescibacterota bacterium]|nr:MAG: UvrD-helicase domain-containing protein [Candidatus Latescibacterota bacterium]
MLEQLNAEQRRAVTAGEGALLVLAGAGSGKTRVLTTRIAYLVHEVAVPAWRILAFTFTNKAAREMRSRVEQQIGEHASQCWVGTFHATGVRILRREATRLGWERNFAIYDTADTEAALKEILSGRTLPRHVSPSAVRGAISQWKNSATTAQRAAEEAANDVERAWASVYADYERALRRNNAFDFDDLIVRPVQLFESEPEVLERSAGRFQHVLVDEFQDTNGIQMRFIELLASRHGNLFVVGDDDQSIYGWRGARIENILEFDKRFRDTEIVRLEQNYRSTAVILDAANELIAHNRGRKGKKLWTSRDGGEPLRLRVCFDEEEEGTRVVTLVQELVTAGRSRDEIVVLYRTNAQSRALEDALRRNNVPYQIVGGTRFYDRREVRDVVAYLKAVHNPADAVAILRAIKVPRRGIGDTTISKLQSYAETSGLHLGQVLERSIVVGLSPAATRRVAEFVQLLTELRELAARATCVSVLNAVLEATGYFDYLQRSDPASYQTRRENVEELVSAAQAFSEESDDASLRAFLEEISLLTDIDGMQERVDQVTLMTLHSAKGLEFPVVCITGVEEGLLPHASNLDAADRVEEERRLFYVGMTRAQQQLHLFCASNRRRFGDFEPMMQSRFLAELPTQGIEIDHPTQAQGRRARWSPRQPSWRSYAEGDPDTFWGGQQLTPEAQPASQEEQLYEDDFPQEPVELVQGMRVRHARFGEGVVVGIEGKGEMMKIKVTFGRHTTKKFVARYARLVPLV